MIEGLDFNHSGDGPTDQVNTTRIKEKRRTSLSIDKTDKKNHLNYFHMSHFLIFSKNLSF